ncbi:hypothetical protein OC846_005560 [Tilletia horrida]|uniref:Uncharacterized protein n=1 Tax=Tilletia horrida TaxID=155126 RepID=A0AAN6JRL5_9BASI|nr:hypothetical protein OC846_005560 [Tilletia horrida]
MLPLGSVPSLPERFRDEKLYDILAQRCAIPNSVVLGVHALAADGLLGTALRQRWNGTLPSQDTQGETYQVGDSKRALPQKSLEIADESGPERTANHEAPALAEQRSPKRRRKAQWNQGTSAAPSTDAAFVPSASIATGVSDEVLDVTPSTASLQSRLAAFDTTTPPSFRLFARPDNWKRPPSHQTESAIIRPTETRRLLLSRPRACEEKQTAKADAAAAFAGGTSSPHVPSDKLVVRLAVSGLHAVGGRRRDATSSHDSSTRDQHGESFSAGSHTEPPEVTQIVETLTSFTLESLSRTIICPTRQLPGSAVNGDQTNSPAKAGRPRSLALDFVATSTRLFLPTGASDSHRDAAEAVCREARLISSAHIDVGSLDATRIFDVSEQDRNEPIWMIHDGDCVHALMITQMRLHTPSEAPTETFPRTITVPSAALRNPMMSMLIKRRFHSDAISPMICGICAAWPGQAIIIGGADVCLSVSDHRHDSQEELFETDGDSEGLSVRGFAEQATVCCARCWAACGGKVLDKHGEAQEELNQDQTGPATSLPKARRNVKAKKGSATTSTPVKGKKKAGADTDVASYGSKAKIQMELAKRSEAEIWEALPIL